ncbi:hypothetical protein [Amycolatopsis orientalis]|uniref:hypothetical protein n=1 Tax=Amycolatopsis orientalis TaxID=31958 RepID=UPI000413269D|nr:hypothetical protein [Amycolatopsis orientalis]
MDLIFARGTFEIPGLGIVGKPLLPALQRALPGKSVSAHALPSRRRTSAPSPRRPM